MARYISLLRFTETGAKNLKKSTARARAFDKAAEKAGVKIEAQFWTLGEYDGLLIISAESDKKALHWLSVLAATGAVHTETMQAFDAAEFEAILGS